MVFSRFFRRAPTPVGSAPATPPGLRIYAVGDVHGRLDLLDRMARLIADDLSRGAAPDSLAIFLGDLIDRGPNSRGVVDRLVSADFPIRTLALRGNHEELLLSFLGDPGALEIWRAFGGLETLHSYGVDVSEVLRGEGYESACEEFRSKLPAAHLRFLQATRLSDERGDYFFCHAGVRPRVPLDRQSAADLLWIRDEFLRFEGDFGRFVVHGHTPVEAPDLRRNRINVDTGAFATDVLTAIALEGSTRRFLSTK